MRFSLIHNLITAMSYDFSRNLRSKERGRNPYGSTKEIINSPFGEHVDNPYGRSNSSIGMDVALNPYDNVDLKLEVPKNPYGMQYPGANPYGYGVIGIENTQGLKTEIPKNPYGTQKIGSNPYANVNRGADGAKELVEPYGKR